MRRTTHHTTTTTATTTGPRHRWYHRTNPNRRAAGLKAAMNNPNTTSEGRHRAKHELKAMGRGREAHTSFSTRIRHWLHLGGRSKHRRTTTRATY